MKKLLLGTTLLLALSLTFTSCKDNKKAESMEEGIENAAEATEDAMEDAADAVSEAADDAGEAVEDAAEETGEAVNDAVEAAKELVDKEEVVVDYSYTVAGKEIKGSKTFSGHQDEVEAAVKKLEDSLKKIDPKITITVK